MEAGIGANGICEVACEKLVRREIPGVFPSLVGISGVSRLSSSARRDSECLDVPRASWRLRVVQAVRAIMTKKPTTDGGQNNGRKQEAKASRQFTENCNHFKDFHNANRGAQWKENERRRKEDAHPSEGPASLSPIRLRDRSTQARLLFPVAPFNLPICQ